MGVHGLTSFIDEHPKFLTDFCLHDTKVLIDGNNLYYFLYYNYFDINVLYGGDYGCYAKSVRYFFQTLNTCNVTPYVIFDGGYDVDERKLKTTLKRQKERLKNVSCLSKGQKGIVLPILAYDVFRQVLDDIGVNHMTCDFEADDQLAALAKHWDVPVMSNDSDFFIFDLPAGFIIFDYINLDIQQYEGNGESFKYISVQLFKLENFVKSYKGLQKELVPIFATLLGNDFVDTEQFESFFARVKFPKVSSSTRYSHRRTRMISLLMWLESQETVDSTVDAVISLMPCSQQEKTKRLLYTSIRSYTDFSSHVLNYFDVKDSALKLNSKLRTYGGNLVPHWIITQLRKAHMPLNAVNALTLHRNLLLQQVELLTEPSSYRSALKIRQIMYSILLSLDQKLNERPAAKKDKRPKENYIEEFDRDLSDLRCGRVPQLSEMPDGSPVPFLQEIPHLSSCERETIFFLSAGVESDILRDIPTCLHFILAVICYWIKNANPKIPEYHVYAIVGSVIKLMALSDVESNEGIDDKAAHGCPEHIYPRGPNTDPDNPPPGISDEINENKPETESRTLIKDFRKELIHSCTEQQKEFAKKNLHRFTVGTPHSASNRFQTLITHNCAQFQSSFQALMHLDMVLLNPVPYPSPDLVYSGTLMYNLCVELQRRAHPKSYLPELFGLQSPLSKLYSLMIDNIMGLFTEEDFLMETSASKAKKKVKAKKKKIKYNEEDDGENGNDERQDESLRANCALSNRFAGLSLNNDLDVD